MYVYAGIDEAGYGPMFGPLVVGRSVFRIPKLGRDSPVPHLWQRLSKAVGRDLQHARGRVLVNDSKKLTTRAAGIKHLERGCLAFTEADQTSEMGQWLDGLGVGVHHDLDHLPWYADSPDRPWEALPRANTEGELAIARGMVGRTCERIGVEMTDLGAGVVFEDRFNRLVGQSGSKAAVNWAMVAKHLRAVWQAQGMHEPTVIVDRLGGRTDYRQPLGRAFGECDLTVLSQSPARAGYHIQGQDRAMTVWFEVNSDSTHMPVALASMTAKYTRELLMGRFKDYFARHVPGIRPTAGYGRDAQRFWHELAPHLHRLGIEPGLLKRVA